MKRTRHHFTPFSMTQVQLENAAGPQDVSKSYPLSVYWCTIPPAPHSCSWCCVVILFSSFDDCGSRAQENYQAQGPPNSDSDALAPTTAPTIAKQQNAQDKPVMSWSTLNSC